MSRDARFSHLPPTPSACRHGRVSRPQVELVDRRQRRPAPGPRPPRMGEAAGAAIVVGPSAAELDRSGNRANIEAAIQLCATSRRHFDQALYGPSCPPRPTVEEPHRRQRHVHAAVRPLRAVLLAAVGHLLPRASRGSRTAARRTGSSTSRCTARRRATSARGRGPSPGRGTCPSGSSRRAGRRRRSSPRCRTPDGVVRAHPDVLGPHPHQHQARGRVAARTGRASAPPRCSIPGRRGAPTAAGATAGDARHRPPAAGPRPELTGSAAAAGAPSTSRLEHAVPSKASATAAAATPTAPRRAGRTAGIIAV